MVSHGQSREQMVQPVQRSQSTRQTGFSSGAAGFRILTMQSTGQTVTQASQPVQPFSLMMAFGRGLRGLRGLCAAAGLAAAAGGAGGFPVSPAGTGAGAGPLVVSSMLPLRDEEDQAWKDDPHPQLPWAFGLLKVKPEPLSPSV